MKRTKRLLAAILSCAMVFALTACGGSDGAGSANSGSLKAIPKEDLKIGFVYVGPVGDEGYSFAHDQGRKKMIENLGLSEDQVICDRKGVMSAGSSCRSFKYDPLKRVPPRPAKADFSRLKDEDFVL